jgi:dephospho-CoA kinase
MHLEQALFGLTGGIASGKSTVAGLLRARGVGVVDADQMAREVVEPGTEGLRRIARQFGPGVLLADGRLDRPALAARVFGDDAARSLLEAITHPLIREASRRRAAALVGQGHLLVAYEAALLVEARRTDAPRPLVLVAASEATQLARLVARDGVTEQQALARLRSQMPLADKLAVADFVIDANGSLEQTAERTWEALRFVCAQKGVDPGRLGFGAGPG